MGHDTNLKGFQCELRADGNEETPGQAQALRVNASHRAALMSADLFPRGQVWVRMHMREDHTRCTKQPPSIRGHEALWTHSYCHNLQGPRNQSRKSLRLRLTDSSFSNSGLHCAASSATGFWTMFLQTSQMVRLAMNMPTSGTNTRIPLPASAPFKLRRQKQGGGNSVVLTLQWLNHHRECLNLLKT